jgi:hypothetical protein
MSIPSAGGTAGMLRLRAVFIPAGAAASADRLAEIAEPVRLPAELHPAPQDGAGGEAADQQGVEPDGQAGPQANR